MCFFYLKHMLCFSFILLSECIRTLHLHVKFWGGGCPQIPYSGHILNYITFFTSCEFAGVFIIDWFSGFFSFFIISPTDQQVHCWSWIKKHMPSDPQLHLEDVSWKYTGQTSSNCHEICLTREWMYEMKQRPIAQVISDPCVLLSSESDWSSSHGRVVWALVCVHDSRTLPVALL